MLYGLFKSSHRGNSNEHTQHPIILQKLEKTIPNYSHLLPDLALCFTLNGSNYLGLEVNFHDPMLEAEARLYPLY